MSFSRAAACGMGICAWLWASLASASPTREELGVARALYEQARLAQRTERWADCQRLVRDAIEIVETPGLRFHLAYCSEQQGQWVDALAAYERAAELLAGGMQAPDVSTLLNSAIHTLRMRLPSVKLEAQKLPGDCVFRIDGQPQSQLLLRNSIPLDPGTHAFELRCKGYAPFIQSINLMPTQAPSLKITLTSTEAPRPKPAPGSEQPGDGPPNHPVKQPAEPEVPKAWLTPRHVTLGAAALLAVSGAALGVGFGLHGASLSARMERQSGALRVSCRRDALTPECVPLLRTAERYDQSRLVAAVSFGGAAVGALVFAASYWLWPAESQSQGQTARQTDGQTQLRWLPMLGVAATNAPLGLVVTGRF